MSLLSLSSSSRPDNIVGNEQTPKTILSHKGYSIKKRAYDLETLEKIRRELTVQPSSHPDYPSQAPFKAFDESQKYLRVPRFYGIERFGESEAVAHQEHPVNAKFNGQLYMSQLQAFSETTQQLRGQKKCGVLCLATGQGKTVCALAVVAEMKQRTLIVSHKVQLLEQWKQEINRFLPGLTVGMVQGTKKQISTDYDITLATIQTLLNIEKIDPIYGMTVIDECHHLSAPSFSRVMFKISSKYVLGLSATPERKDGTTFLLDWHLGGVFYSEGSNKKNQNAAVDVYHYPFGQRETPKKYSTFITHVVDDDRRNEYLLRILSHVIAQDSANHRKVLILTARRGHAKFIYDKLSEMNASGESNKTCGLFIGQMKIDELEREKEKDIIVATYNIFSEGISVAKLNTLFLATPVKDVVQVMGRIFRKVHENVRPMIMDVCDEPLKGQMYGRLRTYRAELDNNVSVRHLKYEEVIARRSHSNSSYTAEQHVSARKIQRWWRKQAATFKDMSAVFGAIDLDD